MKFGFVLTNLAGGGAEKAVLKLSSALAAGGDEVHLILLESVIEQEPSKDLSIHALTAPGRKLSKGIIGRRLAARRLGRLVRRLEDETPFDLLVSTLPFADEVSILAKLEHHWCRIANTLSAEIERLRATNPRKATRRLAKYRRLYGVRPLIAVSDGVASDLRDQLLLRGNRIERIYNPFDFDDIRNRATAPAPRPAGPYVIHVGRFAAQKRHDVLLDAWARLAVPHTLVLLTAPDPRLTRMIDARGLASRVNVAGFQANPYPWIGGAALLVLSSDYEGLPNVLIEALALGVPVVSTDCPSGPREILGPAADTCLVPMGDAQALAQAIGHALTLTLTPARAPALAQIALGCYATATVVADYRRIANETSG